MNRPRSAYRKGAPEVNSVGFVRVFANLWSSGPPAIPRRPVAEATGAQTMDGTAANRPPAGVEGDIGACHND